MDSNLNIYKITTDNAVGPFPFCLVDAYKKHVSFREQLAKEYWNSTLNWKFNEYECDKMEIVEKVNLVGSNAMVGSVQLMDDCTILKNWIKRPNNLQNT